VTAYPYRWRRLVREAIEAGATCADCGTDQDLEGDHELAVSRGGLSTRANLVIRCRLHNRRKGNRPPVRVQLALAFPLPAVDRKELIPAAAATVRGGHPTHEEIR
jgi:5-methylcytosine-specific restriction endonuclease McrA